MSAPLYERASVSKALAFTSIVCTMLVAYFDVPAENLLKRPMGSSASPLKLVQNLVLSQTAFRRVFPELAIGVGILYVFRHLERVVGARKFFSFCLASSTLSLAMQVCVLMVLGGTGGEQQQQGVQLTAGPFAPLFSLFVLYFWHVPALSFPVVNSLKYNSKLPVYGAGLFLATIEGRASLLPAGLSLLAGIAVYTQFAKLDVPDSVAKFGTKYVEPLFRQSDPPAHRRGGGARQVRPQYGGFGHNDDDNYYGDDQVLLPGMFGAGPVNAAANRGGANQPPIAPAAGTPAPREEDVLALVQMGFEVEAATEALRRNRNDVNRAADSLLFQQ
ncbi:hypothetical protein BASA81_002930 [Batrachochytrium salamandrivorans]|nr:hypothetical protein BASA81_002930 [Batrachochytrium salamandrivorans]